jgi:hypothetical protein
LGLSWFPPLTGQVSSNCGRKLIGLSGDASRSGSRGARCAAACASDKIVGTTQLQHENSVSIAPWFAIVRAVKQETTGRNLLCDTP